MATPEVKVSLNLVGKQAVTLLEGISTQLEKLESKGVKAVKKTDLAIGNMVGTLGALAAVKAFQFLKDQMVDSFDTFVDYEAGLINVAKTANLTAKEVDELSKEILDMSSEIPATTEELLSIATAAGQLGVKGVTNLSLFTKTIAKLGRVSDLSGDQAATTLTRILNVAGEGIDTIDTFSSVIVSLGNNFAASESEIAGMTNEVIRATSTFGVSAAEAAALSAALRSMGVRSEEAGGVLSKAFVKINEAINKGGEGLAQLEKITGKSGEAIKKQFGEDAIGFFRDFVAGLNTIEGGAKNSSVALGKLGIDGIRVAKVLPVLAENVSEFDRALALANKEMGNSNALNEEYEKSLKSTKSQTDLLSNSLERLRIKVGKELAAALALVSPKLIELIDNAAKSDIQLFADSTEDVVKLNKTLSILKKELKIIQEGSSVLPDFLGKDPDELSAKIKVLSNRINELGEAEATATLANLRTELVSLDDQIKSQDPIVNSLYGDPADALARKDEIIAQIKNIEQAQILSGQKIATAEKAQADASKARVIQKLTFLQELALAGEAAATEAAEVEKQREQVIADEKLQFLEDNLGAEAAARELHRIRHIKDEKKRNIELKKLQAKALENSKAATLFSLDFEKKVGLQKVQAQKQVLQDISGLQASSNGAAFAIGKAAAATLAYINTQQAVTNALANVPYPFNFAAAVAVGAAGAINIANIASAKPPSKSAGSFANGGIVGGSSFSGDNLNANVNSGEAILNKRQQTNLFNAVDNNDLGGGGTNITINNPMVLSEDGVSNLIDEINDAIEFKNKELRTA